MLLIERIFKEQGPFDGILGFSQGAAFVAILCSMQQKKCMNKSNAHPFFTSSIFLSLIYIYILHKNYYYSAVSSIRFDFAILISGFKSLCESHSLFYNEQLDIPTLHVYGTTDQIIPISE